MRAAGSQLIAIARSRGLDTHEPGAAIGLRLRFAEATVCFVAMDAPAGLLRRWAANLDWTQARPQTVGSRKTRMVSITPAPCPGGEAGSV